MRRRTVLSLSGGLLLQACGAVPAVSTPAPTPLPQLAAVMRTPAPHTTHQLIEVDVRIWPEPDDRFDIAANDIWLEARHAQTTLRVPVFWTQTYADGVAQAPTASGWLARFNLAVAGEWRIRVVRATQTSAELTLMVVDHPRAHGRIQVSGTGFAYADDMPFLPIGVNLGWSTNTGDTVLQDYARWFTQLAANGGNTARIWMASWSFGIEWNDTPLGDYTARMPQAWLLDQVLELAQQHGIAIMLCLINHGAFSQTTNAEWDANPYNAANGGPLSDPAAFVTNPQARTLFSKRLRYIAARYAAHPALWCWEWWNEIDWTSIQDDDLRPWLADMRAVITSVDPYDHSITSSWSNMAQTALWSESSLDFVQHHTYQNDDLVRTLNAARIPLKPILKTKPLLISEVGLDVGGATAPTAVERVHLINAVWAPVFLGMAGSGMYWWWDTWIDPQQQWDALAGLAAFMQGIDYRTLRPFTALMAHDTVLGLKDDTTVLLWIRHARYTARDAMQAYQQLASPASDWAYQCHMAEWQPLALSNLTDGTYACSVWDTALSQWQTTSASHVVDTQTTVAIPPFVNDCAVRMIRI